MKLFAQFPGGRYLGKEEIKNVTDVLNSRSPYRFSGLNLKMYCNKLEKAMAKFVNKKYCLTVKSGTAALTCALQAVEIKRGDEVIVPAYGWSADLMSIIMMGAVPVIAPVSDDGNLDLEKVKNSITKKTKALIVIHMRGYPCNFKKIVNIFKKKKYQ
jgi:8-amino-3,8-dideoxy-alpha-D-manno-octulosonate transaminase